MLAEAALQAIVSSEEFSEILREAKRLESLRQVCVDLASDDPTKRLNGIERGCGLIDLDPSLVETLRGIARSDSDPRVRCAAIRSLPLAALQVPRRPDVLNDLVLLLGDESEQVRHAAAKTVPYVFAPRAQKFDAVVQAAIRHRADPSFLASATLALETAAQAPLIEDLRVHLLEASGVEFEMMLALLAPSRKARTALLATISRQIIGQGDDIESRSVEVERRLLASEIRWCCSSFQRSWEAREELGFRVVGTEGDGGPDFFLIARAVLQSDEAQLAKLLADVPIQFSSTQRTSISNCPWCGANLARHYGVQPLPLVSREKV